MFRVVYQHVDATKSLYGSLYNFALSLREGDIPCNDSKSLGVPELFCRFGEFRLVTSVKNDVGTLPDIGFGHTKAEAT